jgi:transcriptional regulator with XRE-family HTH domain
LPRPRRRSETIGQRIKRYRVEKEMSLSQLAAAARLSKSYLSELESGNGSTQRPSADVLYRIGNALGVAMSDLLDRPVIIEPKRERPPSLLQFAKQAGLPEADVEMLAGIEFRGEQPRTPERWSFIYQAIRNSERMDD